MLAKSWKILGLRKINRDLGPALGAKNPVSDLSFFTVTQVTVCSSDAEGYVQFM